MTAPPTDTMTRVAKICLFTWFKICNSITGILGTSIFIYSLWMIGVCIINAKKEGDIFILPWFVGALLGLGISYCVVAGAGFAYAISKCHICFNVYIVLMIFHILLESMIIGDVIINQDWEQNFPDDPTKRFKDFVEFIEDHIDFFRYFGLLVALSQIASVILATVLRTMKAEEYRTEHGNIHVDQLSTTTGVPFLNHHVYIPADASGSPPRFLSNKWVEY